LEAHRLSIAPVCKLSEPGKTERRLAPAWNLEARLWRAMTFSIPARPEKIMRRACSFLVNSKTVLPPVSAFPVVRSEHRFDANRPADVPSGEMAKARPKSLARWHRTCVNQKRSPAIFRFLFRYIRKMLPIKEYWVS
jgi:hypothetical protein